MAVNCGLGWQIEALREALGTEYQESHQPDDDAPGLNLHILRWECGDAYVSAVKSPIEYAYTIEASCGDQEHNDLHRFPSIVVGEPKLVDASGKSLSRVPKDLKGVRFKFNLNAPVSGYVRVEVFADPERATSRIIDVDGGVFAPGISPFDLTLTENDDLERPLYASVQISVHVLTKSTAIRDANAAGLCLWSHEYPV